PFVSNNMVEIMARKATERAPSLGERRPDLPKALIKLVDDCLEIDPALRPQSAREFLNRLEEIMRNLPPDEQDVDVPDADSSTVAPVRREPASAPSGPSTRPKEPDATVPMPTPVVPPVALGGYDAQRKVGMAAIVVAAVLLLWVAF